MKMTNSIEDEIDDHMFSDPEDYVDDISDSELLPDILSNKPQLNEGVDTLIVVDGIPQVGPDRIEKLRNVLRRIFTKYGNIVSEEMPIDETGKTKGFIFIEYETPEIAQEALKGVNNYRLDKQHIFTANLFTDFDKYEKIPENWEPPQPQPYVDHGNLRSWLLDPDCYDQFSVMYDAGQKTALYLNSQPEPTLLKERENWTESFVTWSPLGTYLATFHSKGIALWGSEEFKQIMKFSHPKVQFLDFSPGEKYLVTFAVPDKTDDPNAIIIWDIRTGQKKRNFRADPGTSVWPLFKWSHDDKYFVKISQDTGTLSIYETPSFGLLEKKSLKIHNIRNFQWSPSDNIISYWVAEEKDVPARVTLIEVPSRKELRSKNLFNVSECKMQWQKSGDHLCVMVVRYSKARKEKNEIKYSGFYYNFEIFDMRDKQIPVDSIEIKEPIHAFNWEPVGNKLAIIHGEPQINVSFYGIKPGGAVTLLKRFEKKQCNHLYWSPIGQFIVLAGLRNFGGTFEFVDTADFTVMGTSEHFMATDVEWDPTGRYVVTSVSWWSQKSDNAYYVWSFQGKIIRRSNMDKLCQFLWRPRPPTLLSEEKIKEIKKNLKKYSTQFDLKDRMSLSKASKELVEKRRKLVEEYREYRDKILKELESSMKKRQALRDLAEEEQTEEELQENTFELLIKEETFELDE